MAFSDNLPYKITTKLLLVYLFFGFSGCGGSDNSEPTVPSVTQGQSRTFLEDVFKSCRIFTGANLELVPTNQVVINISSENVTGLNCKDLAAETLSSFGYFPNLRYLHLKRAGLTQLTGIDQLNKLEDLDLSENKLTSIEPLIGLKKLKKLSVGFNRISDVTPLISISSLTHIGLESNPITNDLTRLYALSGRGLQEIRLAHNRQLSCVQIDSLRSILNNQVVVQAPEQCANSVTFNPKTAKSHLVIDNTQPGVRRVERVALQVEHTIPIDHIKTLLSGIDLIITIHEPIIQFTENPLDILTEFLTNVPVVIHQHQIIIKNWRQSLSAQIDTIAIPNPKDGTLLDVTLGQIGNNQLAPLKALTALPVLTGGVSCELTDFPLPDCRLIAFNLFSEACKVEYKQDTVVDAQPDDAVVFGPTVLIANLTAVASGVDLVVTVQDKGTLTLLGYLLGKIPDAVIIEKKAYPAALFFAALIGGLDPTVDPDAVVVTPVVPAPAPAPAPVPAPTKAEVAAAAMLCKIVEPEVVVP